MDLKDFIKSTLTQIVQAVEEANAVLTESKAVVSPTGYYAGGSTESYIVTESKDSNVYAEMVEFDVALTARDESGNTGGVAVTIATIGLGTRRTKELENTSVSRIKFKIPVLLPQTEAGNKGTPRIKFDKKTSSWGGIV